MAQKRYGPTEDAGTVIVEEESEKTIQKATLGVTAYTGPLERGPVGELITTTGKRDLLRKTGGLIPETLLPDACQDFWDHSKGAGLLLLYRVTDGNEVVATLDVYDRTTPTRNLVGRIDAHDGGGWGGRRDTVVADLDTVPTDITSETTVKLPDLYVVAADKWKGGTITFTETGTSYAIVSNTAGDGITGAVVTVAADAKMLTDYGAGTDEEITLKLVSQDAWGQEKKLAVKFTDGQDKPSTEFGMYVYLNGALVREYPDLSGNPISERYWVDLVNDDDANHYVEVTDLWTGAHTADTRPANHFGEVDSAEIAEKVLTIDTVLFQVDSSNVSNDATLGVFTIGSKCIKDTLKVTYVLASTEWSVESTDKMVHHVFPPADGIVPTAYPADNDYSFGFTVDDGTTPVDTDYFLVTALPLVEDEAIGGKIFLPEEAWAPVGGFAITDNDEGTATIVSGDMTNGGTITGDVKYRLEFAQELQDGYDGLAELAAADYTPAYEVNTSPFNDTVDEGYGLIKFATPSVTTDLDSSNAQSVEIAGRSYTKDKNHQYRYEIPSNKTDEYEVKTYVQDTLGKTEYAKVCHSGYCKVDHPVLKGRLRTIPTTGMIHGREASTARTYKGFHKVAAGVEVDFPRIKELMHGKRVLNGEVLNPAGIQRIVRKGGKYVLWGAKLPYEDPAFKFCQHREMLSHWEQNLSTSFDWIIYAINDAEERPGAIAALKSFFLPEWRNRALRGSSLDEAAPIKVDEENNDDATMAAGDMQAEVGPLRLADTVERFIITISKAGIFETVV